jgi:RimJ/RimL family protein N-acetyltransferase
VLREVRPGDLDALFEQQREPEGVAMAIFPARDREAFDEHWRKVLANECNVVRVIEVDGEVAGNIGSWKQDGRQLVGYWLGRDFWGQGLATAALAELAQELPRPLHAWVASSNAGSIRVLEKCGFARVGREDHGRGGAEYLYELR